MLDGAAGEGEGEERQEVWAQGASGRARVTESGIQRDGAPLSRLDVRVLHVTPYFPPTWAYGGIPRVVVALGQAQARQGADVRVWTTDAFDRTSRAGVSPRRSFDGIDVHTSRLLSNRLAWSQQLFLPTTLPPLDGVDVVHLHGHRHLLNFAAFHAARRAGIPIVQTPNGTLPRIERKVTAKRVWDWVFDGDVPLQVDALVATSRAEVRDFLLAGVAGSRIRRIPNGLVLEDFANLPPRGSFRALHGWGPEPLVVYLGQITPRKGVEHLVAACAKIPNVRLAIAGSARGMALPAGNAHYLGTLEGPERLRLLVDADVLVYASAREVFGLVPLEGLLCGAPVIVGGDCGCGEMITEAGAGLLVDHGDVDSLTTSIRTLLSDQGRAEEMVRRGQAWIAHNADSDKVAARYLDLYRELA